MAESPAGIEQREPWSIDVKGPQSASEGGGVVEAGVIADVQGFLRAEVEGAEGVVENRGIRFAGPCIGGRNDEIKGRSEAEAAEDGMEAAVEIRDDGEFQTGLAGAIDKLRDFRKDLPRSRVGVVIEEGIEGGWCDLLAEGRVDEVAPPAAFDFMAILGHGEIRRRESSKGMAEGSGHGLRSGFDAMLTENPGVDFADGFDEVDESPGGIEEKGADHGGKMVPGWK